MKNAETGHLEQGGHNHKESATNTQTMYGKIMVHKDAQPPLQSSAHHCSNSRFMRLTQNVSLGKTTKWNFGRSRQKEKKVNSFYLFSNGAKAQTVHPVQQKRLTSFTCCYINQN